MDQMSLQALLESDREMILSNLARDRSPAAAQTVLEKAVDRVMYRYVEACPDAVLRDQAQYILQSIRNALPFIDAVGEAREWKKTVDVAGKSRKKPRASALALLALGATLVLASVIAMLIGGGFNALSFLKSLLPAALGVAAAFWAGVLIWKPKKERAASRGEPLSRTEFLIDAEKAFHCLRGAMAMADHQLETIRQENAVRRQESDKDAANVVSRKEIDLFAELLETAYAAENDADREMISAIRFYLHGKGIEAVDLEPGRESWFETLPARRPGTLRPALVKDGRLLKKGLASAGRD